jgi:hypothetical protein
MTTVIDGETKMAASPRLSTSQRLRNRLEDELDIYLPAAPQRIYGESSASCRWFVSDRNGIEYLSYHPMSECVRSDVKLVVSTNPSEPSKKFVSIEPITESKD